MIQKIFQLICVLCIICITNASAQSATDTLTAVILHEDSAFWNAYNNCDTGGYKNFFTEDVEFYHDKGGITTGASSLIQSLEKNLCSNPDYHLRREAVAGTVKVYPMKKDNEIYGAIIMGEHLFYITQNGKPEFLDGDANFTDLWIINNGEWKMKRVLSYNHHAADYINKRTEITLPAEKLDALTGTYKSSRSGEMKLKRADNLLLLYNEGSSFTLYPQSDTSFFTKDRDLVFEFVKDGSGKPLKMIVKEHGVAADELVFEK